jgi:uncharacterized protein DUF4338/DDE family transposase
MNTHLPQARAGSAQRLTTHIISEKTARHRFNALLDQEHALGSRKAKGRSVYQVICDEKDRWVALVLWTGACWHLGARDQWVGWDPMTRSERLQLVVHQARFLVLQGTRDSVWSSAVLAAAVRDLPGQWEEVFDYRPLLAETFTDPETHEGTCYKAAGWEPAGLSSGEGKHYADNFPESARPKKLWLKPLVPKAREKLCAPELPSAQQAGLAGHAGVRCALKALQLASLYETFSRVPDPRRRNSRRYRIETVLTLIALGLLRGAVHLSTIVRTAQKLTQAQRKQLRLPFKKGTKFRSVPCYDVFRDVLRGVDLQVLAERLTQWLQAHAGELPRTLAVDGKIIRDKLGLIVTLVDTEEGTPVAVAANVEGKGHELKTTQVLLASPEVNLVNATVTADSLHCQDKTAHIVAREKGGQFLFQVRDNQPTLHQLAQSQLADKAPLFLQPTAITVAPSSANSAA